MSDDKDIFGIKQKSSEIKESFISGFSSSRAEGDVYDVKSNPNARMAFISRRIDFFLAVVIVFCCSIFVALARLQIVEGSYHLSLAEENRIRKRRISASRGLIFDRNGDLLTRNEPTFSLLFAPADFTDDDELKAYIIEELVSLFPQKDASFRTVFEEAKDAYLHELYVLKDDVDYEQAIKLMIASSEWPGVSVARSNKRVYTTGEATALSIGYTGLINREEYEAERGVYRLNDHKGKTGLELFYEKELRGTPGSKKVEVDVLGRELNVLAQRDAVSGNDLVLTIDLALQKKIIEVLEEAMQELGVTRAAAVALDPRNGEVLALVSLPSYDNNLFVGGISQADYASIIENPHNPLFNRAIKGEYPPGSTFKVIVASAGLEEEIITKSTRFLSLGGLEVGQSFFPDWRAGGHGLVNVEEAHHQRLQTTQGQLLVYLKTPLSAVNHEKNCLPQGR